MNEILKMLNELSADDLESVITRAHIILEKKRKEEAEKALLEKERLRQERLEQEKMRQQEIAELQRKLKELQSQSAAVVEPVKGDDFVMFDSVPAANKAPSYSAPVTQPAPAKAAPAQSNPASTITCPYCHKLNIAGSMFCEKCGKRLSQSAQPAAPKQTAPQSAPAYQQNWTTTVVRHEDGTMKKWEMLPGESIVQKYPEIQFIQPAMERKYVYSMQVTNKRILLSREGSFSAGMHTAGAMGGGLLGGLIMDGIKAATGAGPKPWMEIPLTAIRNCGVQNKKEFFIEADQTYVLRNKNYENVLPALVANAKK
ncbi:MAG: hypothetical protein E7319_11175 [Clostridiales bacterium]|nr:hypothetical protein [Clostridiales bacterium]